VNGSMVRSVLFSQGMDATGTVDVLHRLEVYLCVAQPRHLACLPLCTLHLVPTALEPVSGLGH
jgi:hypothetical protein